MKDPDLISKTLYYQLADLFEISAIYSQNKQLIFRARPHLGREEAVNRMQKRLKPSGFVATVREDREELLITIKEVPSKVIPKLNVVLFLATLVTMFFAEPLWNYGIMILVKPGIVFEYLSRPGVIEQRIAFTAALMAILLFHEFGHYLAGRRRGVFMSLPYFIPAPNLVGTFGAVIKSRSPLTNRRDLIEVGAIGPIAGFVVAVIVLSFGLHNSEIVLEDATAGWMLGDSLLIKFLSWLFAGPLPEGHTIVLSEAAFAGWVGLLVTMINLLPIGQLDGGHIIYGLFGRKQHKIGKLFLVLMLVLGFWWPGWWFFGVLVFLFGVNHPPTINDTIRPSKATRVIGLAAIVIFIISFIPVPFALS